MKGDIIMKWLLIVILGGSSVYSQKKYVVKNEISGEVVSYASIEYLNENRGVYTNEQGTFNLELLKGMDSIKVSHVNFQSKIFAVNKLGKEIFLTPKSTLLKEVVVFNKKKVKERNIGYIKKNKVLSWFIQPKSKLTTLLKVVKNYNENSIIKTIQIPIGKKGIVQADNKYTKWFPKFNAVFRVELYSNKDNKPDVSLLENPITINCNQNSDNIISIDVSNQYISFPKEGVFVCVEMINSVVSTDNNTKILRMLLPSFKFTKKKKRNIYSESYAKFVFSKKGWINLKTSEEFNHIANYHMAVGLVISIYD